jgi:7-cyano-7-deazaguanine synthase
MYKRETSEFDSEFDLVILFSGGADSRLLLELAHDMGKRPYCVLIDYGQKHIKELECATTQLNNMKIPFIKISIKNLNIKSGLTGDGAKGLYKNVSIYNVPARNSIFLTIAAGIAESENIKCIWIGCDMDDFYNKFPDCKQSYIGKINELFSIALSEPIVVEAPLLGLSKENVLKLLDMKYNVKKDEIYSGYGEVV